MNESVEKMCISLKLAYTKRCYQDEVNEAMNNNFSYKQFLELILKNELNLRAENGIKNRIRNARFPYLKTFEELDYNAFSLEIANKIRELKSLSFMDYGRNVILIGNPGVGKTHTAISIGVKACQEGKSVLYITVPNLITELKESMTINQLSNYKKKFINYDLVILDELGYISFDKQGSELLFNLLSMRNDSKSIIITSNLNFNKWNEVFNDPILTTAMVDRLVHKSIVLNIKGDSYRFKETKELLGVLPQTPGFNAWENELESIKKEE